VDSADLSPVSAASTTRNENNPEADDRLSAAVQCRAEAGQWLQELVFLIGQVRSPARARPPRLLLLSSGVARVNDLDPVATACDAVTEISARGSA
jgi:hypothetical protein